MVISLVIKLQKKLEKPGELHRIIIQKQLQLKKKILALMQKHPEKDIYVQKKNRKCLMI